MITTAETTTALPDDAQLRGAPVRALEADPYCLLIPIASGHTSGHAAEDAAEVVAHALAVARAGGARRVITAVDASGPWCGPVLAAARSHLGAAVARVDIRRAGSSVMVDVALAD